MITHVRWRRALEVFDAYDADRVVSEELADDLVNDLAGRGTGGRSRRRGVATGIGPAPRTARARLTVVGGARRVRP